GETSGRQQQDGGRDAGRGRDRACHRVAEAEVVLDLGQRAGDQVDLDAVDEGHQGDGDGRPPAERRVALHVDGDRIALRMDLHRDGGREWSVFRAKVRHGYSCGGWPGVTTMTLNRRRYMK